LALQARTKPVRPRTPGPALTPTHPPSDDADEDEDDEDDDDDDDYEYDDDNKFWHILC